MTSDFEELGPKGCPYLGLEEDRTVMLLDPSPLHRCFANPGDIQAPTVQHQSTFCLTEQHVGCPLYQRAKPQALSAKAKGDGRGGRPNSESSRSGAYVAAGALGLLLVLGGGWLALQFFGGRNEAPPAPALVLSPQPDATNTEIASGTVVMTPEAAGTAENVAATSAPAELAPATATAGATTAAANESATATPEATDVSLYGFVTPTPIAGAQQTEFRPGTGDVGWWTDGPDGQINLNDSYLYAGVLDGQNYLAAARFDLKRIPRGTPILGGELRLTGLRADQFDPNASGTWLVQLIGQSELSTLGGANFMMIYSAPASVTLLPQLTSAEVTVGGVNRWVFDANTLQWIEQQRLNGSDTIVARIVGATGPGGQSLFGWDSGVGPTSAGNGPILALSLGPAPTETPPLPTRDFIVATFTPAPENALTVVAQQATATAGAAIAGTNTPVPYFVTPTPFPQNLATVQAAAALQRLPAVVVDTPTPASPATATANADYATAVALTTGTFTPVPTGYVTPVRILPSPPPENMLTAVARNEEATAVAASGGPTATPLPYNAVIAQYIEATLTPQNLATAAVLAREATAQAALQGTATPTPWEWYVITPTPVPQATPTPTLPIFIPEADFTPTPTPLPGSTEVAPAVLPPEFTNKIFFRTNRTGSEEVFVLDPVTSSVGKITRDWVYPLAMQQLALSPDGTKIAVVKPDNNGILQIYVRSLQYNTDTQLTAFGRDSYDPTWSPTGEWIAFVSTDPGNDEIYRVSVDGKIVQRLTTNSFEWDKHPTWSPDGSQIVFYSNRDTGRRQLWIMNADGGNQRNLTADEYENWEPVWTH